MLKKIKRLAAATLAVATVATTSFACKPKNDSTVTIDSSKTQLNVGVFNAGLGTVYFDEMVKDFEKYYENYEFEPGSGKKGVQVVPLKKKEEFTPGNLVATMKNYDNVLYLLDQGNYTEFVNQGLLEDITATVKEKIFDERGDLAEVTGNAATKSIEDAMLDGYADCFLSDGKYYAIPFWISVPGIIYDADLFDAKGYYYKANGSLGAKQADIDAGTASVGPDGKKGTADDGLPADWNEFVKLMKRMRDTNVIPFTWDDQHNYQRSGVFNQFWANYEGYDNFMLNYSFDGYDTGLNETITEDNYALLANQEGRKAAIKAFYDIMSDKNNYSQNAVNGNNHTDAEFEYVDSVNENKRIAMFMELSYWESEARAAFDQLAQENPDYAYGKRDFRLMPIPKFTGVDGITDQTNTERVIVGRGADNYICISAQNKSKNTDVQVEVAKKFIQFIQQREQLVKFTANTGCFRSYEFTATDAEKETFTKYGQSIMRYIDEGAILTSNLPLANKRKVNVGRFDETNNAFAFIAKKGNDVALYDPISYFLKYKNQEVESCYTDFKATFAEHFDF